jgi:hypothetical protein
MYYLVNDLMHEDSAYVFSDAKYHKVWIGGILLSACFLWLLSMFWFVKITRGILKALGLGAKKKDK